MSHAYGWEARRSRHSRIFFRYLAMLRTTIIAATAACASSLTVGAGVRGAPARASMPAMSFYEFEGTTIGGEKATMADFKGKPVLVMNVASL